MMTRILLEKSQDMIPLDMYDDYPKEMIAYLKNYGWNFNKKSFELAVKNFKKQNVKKLSKEEVEELLKKESVELKNNQLYNATYVANHAINYHFGSSLTTNTQIANYVKECIDNNDSDTHFVQWYATMCHSGKPIPWEEIL